MSDKTNITFTPEQISKQSERNFSSLSLVLAAYLKDQALSLEDFWSFVGRQYAPSWGKEMSAKEIVNFAALNMVSIGCDLYSSSAADSHAEAVFVGWPSEDSLEIFGLTQEEADSIWGTFGSIAKYLGYEYEWQRQGDQVTIRLSR